MGLLDFFRVKIFLLLVFSCYICSSQKNRTYFHELNLDGVPFNKEVNVLFEDSIGFLWLGTKDGLYRYDGHDLIAYRYDVFDGNSIPNNGVNSIIEDDYQNLWIGSESFLISFNRKEQIFKGYYKNSFGRILGKSKDGSIWVGRGNKNLVKIVPHKNVDSTQFETHFNYGGNSVLMQSDKRINSLVQDDFGRYWFATPDGIAPFGKDFQIGPERFKEHILILKAGPKQTLLALTNDTLYVLAYQEENRTLHSIETYPIKGSSQEHITPTSLAIDHKDNSLWIGTTDGLVRGLWTGNRYTFSHFGGKEDTRGSLLDNKINSVLVDHYGNLWIGTHKGVNKYIGRNSIFDFQHVETQYNLDNDLASSFYFDKSKNIWVGINKVLHLVRDNKISKEYASSEVLSVIKSDYLNNELFIGTGRTLLKSRNLYSSNKKIEFDTIKTFNKPISEVLSISADETWVGLFCDGIAIINSGDTLSDFKRYVINQLEGKGMCVSVLLMDKHGIIWVGTRGLGLYKIDMVKEELNHYLPIETKGLSSNAILSLLEVGDKIWIGTRGGGLNVYDQTKGTFESYGESLGLRSTTISSLQPDKAGNIWVSTQNGLARFDVIRKRFVNFGMEDGVLESQFKYNSSSANAAEGILYFGCADGYYTVQTESFQATTIKPQTVITSFKTLGAVKGKEDRMEAPKSRNLLALSDKKVELPYDRNTIAIAFTSLDLTAPHKNEYAYMLEGISDYWVYTTASNRNANYNDLPPGEYLFKVKSSNSDGVWNEDPTELSFSIAAPFWRSDMAYLGYTLFILFSIGVTTILMRRWYRLKKNLIAETVSRQKDNQHNRMKMVFFTDISHELRTPLTLIQGTLEKVIRQKQYSISPLTAQRLHNNSLRMGSLIKQIMDIRKFDVGEFKVKVAKGNMVTDILKIKNAFNDFAKIYHIKYSFNTQERAIEAWYDAQILEKILFNLLSNAFKYTPEKGEIKIHLALVCVVANDPTHKGLRAGKYIECDVIDNGAGIAQQDLGFIFERYYQSSKLPSNQVPGTGIGMELVQKLLYRHHGHISVVSEENVVTKFTFLLPIEKEHYSASEISVAKEQIRKEGKMRPAPQMIIPENTSLYDVAENQNTRIPKVLLVEDNDELRAMLKEELTPDFCVLESSNGSEGYARAVSEQPQLIISDILMPVEDGISLLKRLKKNSEICHIPVIMLTARESHEISIECLSMGADDFIEKPYSLEYVKWKVRNILLTRKQLKEKYSKIITVEPSEIEVESNDDKFIKKLIRIIENSIDDDLLGVEFLASEVGMSRANLYRKLQFILNDTPVNFIKQIRLKRAAQLLRTHTMYISEIAYRTGFSNQKYFSKCFSKQYGQSPSDYAKAYAKKTDIKKEPSVAIKDLF